MFERATVLSQSRMDPKSETGVGRRIGARLRAATAILAPAITLMNFVEFSEDEIAEDFRAAPQTAASLDEQSWADLDAWSLHQQIGGQCSIVGQQYLYTRLRSVSSEHCIANLRRQFEHIHVTERSAEVRKRLVKLKRIPFGIADLSRGSSSPGGRTVALLSLFQVLMLAAWGGLAFSFFSLIPLAVLVGVAFIVQLAWTSSHAGAEARLDSLTHLLSTAIEVADSGDKVLKEVQSLSVLRHELVDLKKAITRPVLEVAMPLTKIYADWFFLSGIKHVIQVETLLAQKRDLIRQAHKELGALEIQFALSDYMQDKQMTWADCGAEAIVLDRAYNPLFDGCFPVSVSTDTSLLVSGQNGAGKSTLLRIIGLNLVMARAFGLCFAKSAAVAVGPLYSSVDVEDSWQMGNSLYMSELARARTMINAAKATPGCVCLIDEIFRGTNHVESVAVSAAVIHELARYAIVIVSTHNLVLAPLLRGYGVTPVVVSTRDGAMSIAEGVLGNTNGVELLREQGLDDHVLSNAQAVASWLAPYLSSPATSPELFHPSP